MNLFIKQWKKKKKAKLNRITKDETQAAATGMPDADAGNKETIDQVQVATVQITAGTSPVIITNEAEIVERTEASSVEGETQVMTTRKGTKEKRQNKSKCRWSLKAR